MENDMNPNGSNTTPMMNAEAGSKVGPIIGVVIIILVLLLGVLYFWGQRVDQTTQENVEEIQAMEEDLGSLESDLNSELAGLEAELEADFTAE